MPMPLKTIITTSMVALRLDAATTSKIPYRIPKPYTSQLMTAAAYKAFES